MVNVLGTFGALFSAAFIFVVANGLLNTLLSARMAAENFSTATAGIVLSCFYTGLLSGSFLCPRLIQRVGHVRAFSVFAATMTAAALLYGLYLTPWFWGLLRFVNGIMTFGLFMVVESWLNEFTESNIRGRVFSIYMTITYLGYGIAQQLLNIGDVQEQTLFITVGIIFSVCLIPVAATAGVRPDLPERKPFRFGAILRKAPLGMLGSMSAGLTNSAFYALIPLFCTRIGLTTIQLSWIMSITVFAGLAAQWLVGNLSDYFDRTKVLVGLSACIAAVTAFIFFNGETNFWKFCIEMGLFGALIFGVYPVSVARAHDIFGGRDTVTVSSGLLFAFSIGASISPALASTVMTLTGTPYGLFLYWFAVSSIFSVTSLYLRNRENVEIVAVEDQVAFVPMKSTSDVVMSLDPRSEVPGETEADKS